MEVFCNIPPQLSIYSYLWITQAGGEKENEVENPGAHQHMQNNNCLFQKDDVVTLIKAALRLLRTGRAPPSVLPSVMPFNTAPLSINRLLLFFLDALGA